MVCRSVIIMCLAAICAAGIEAGTYDYAGTHHNSGARENDWNSAASWANGPGAYPDATGDTARTVANVAGDVWLYLNEDITVGTLSWQGNQLFLYPGSPEGALTVATGGGPAFWAISTPYRFKIYADMMLAVDLVISNTNTREAELDGIISGPGKLNIVWNQSQANDGYEFLLGEAGDGPNSYSGGTELSAVNGGMRGEFRARKNGVFGSGDVIVQPNATLILNHSGTTDDMIADSATLQLHTQAGAYALVQLETGVRETVDRLILGGVEQFPGTYGASGSGAEILKDNYFRGSGVLTVLSGPPGPGGINNGTGATHITANGAELNGEVLYTNYSPTSVFIYWGANDGGSETTAWEHELEIGIRGPGPFSAWAGGGSPLQTLYYRCYITNVLGVMWAAPSVGYKLHGPPELRNERAILRADSVILRGTVDDTNGYPTTAWICWGTADGGTNAGAWNTVQLIGNVSNGPFAFIVSNLTEHARYYYRAYATNSFGEAWAETTASFAAPGRPGTNDITFFCISDIHYGLAPEVNTLAPLMVDRMNELPGTAWPAGIDDSVVQPPRGVVVAGDTATSSLAEEWAMFTRDYGLQGEGRLAYPVYEGYGNHDGGDTVVQQMKNRTPQRKGVTRISADGYHYSWDWDFLHLIHLNVSPGLTYHPYDPRFSYTFLTNDLALSVGDSDRPVIIFQHFGYDASSSGWWPAQDRTNFFEAIAPYNVIAVVHGHAHDNGFYTREGITICNTPHIHTNIEEPAQHGFLVFHVTSNSLHAAVRTSEDTWGATLEETIPVPEPAGILSVVIAGLIYYAKNTHLKTRGRIR